MAATLDEYDLLIYPGFMRRPMARWNEDGSCAPMARARGPKGEAFQLSLKQSEIDDDIQGIEHEVSGFPKRGGSRALPAVYVRAKTRASAFSLSSAAGWVACDSRHGGERWLRSTECLPPQRSLKVFSFPLFPSASAAFLLPCRNSCQALTRPSYPPFSVVLPYAQIGIGKKPKKKKAAVPAPAEAKKEEAPEEAA
jgi:hypothetical protein